MENDSAGNNGTVSNGPSFAPIDDAAEVRTRATGRPITNDSPEAAKRRARDQARRERQRAEQGSARSGAQPPPPPTASGAPPPPPGASPLGKTVNDLKAHFANDGANAGPGAPPQQPSPAAFTATGVVLLGMCNAVLPNLFASFTNKSRVDTVSPEVFRLTDKEVELLKPSAAPAEAYLLMNLHPVAIFGIALAGTMFAKMPPKTKADIAAEEEKNKQKKVAKARATKKDA